MLPPRESDRVILCPSILSADFAALGDAIDSVADDADWIHVDVMDGHFVPNLTIGPPVVRSVRRRCRLPLDVHLMIERPIDWIEPFAEAGADSIVVHAEACVHLQRALQRIRDVGCTPGVAINPGTPIGALEEVIPFCGLILLMTVNPGYGGQSFVPGMTEKIERLRRLLDRQRSSAWLQIDGGISPENIAVNAAAGADVFVVGSSVFGQPDPAEALRILRCQALSGASERHPKRPSTEPGQTRRSLAPRPARPDTEISQARPNKP